MTATDAGFVRVPAPFRPYHKWDRNFFLLMVAAIWFGVVLGFGTDTIRHIQSGEAAYPAIVHVHAVAYVGWLVLLATQVLLIRNDRQDIHRKLGVLAIGLALFMIVIGPLTTFVAAKAQLGTPNSNPPFLAIPLCAVTAFAGLVAAAVLLRKNSSAHKRLIILGTLVISNAGFARLLRSTVFAAMGHNMLSFYFSIFLASDILILAMAGYDLYTRHKLHPAFIGGVAWTAAFQALTVILFFSPWWQALSLQLISA